VTGAVAALSPGLATGALTTAMGFFAMTLTGFRGFAELGVLAGLGILLSLVAMVTLLPALLRVVPQRVGRERAPAERRIGRALLALQRPWLAGALVLAALAALLAGGPGFDSDYLSLEPKGSEAVRLEREMVARTELSPQFAAFVRPSGAAATELAGRLRREPTVAAVHAGTDLAPLAVLGADPAELAALAARFVSPRGLHAVYAYPRGDIWDPVVRDRFVARMRELDPAVTGMPFLGRFMIDLSHRALRIAAGLALAVLLVCVWLDLRRLPLALLALLPTAGGLLLMRGLMALLGLPFNPLNVMALPVVIGVGEDNAVHLLHRLREENGNLARALAGTGRSLVLTSGTTVASFAALSFASHRGLASFAQTLALGIASTLVFSLLVLPQLARWWMERAEKVSRSPDGGPRSARRLPRRA
jgi:predicted RND superfamily exporter protein